MTNQPVLVRVRQAINRLEAKASDLAIGNLPAAMGYGDLARTAHANANAGWDTNPRDTTLAGAVARLRALPAAAPDRHRAAPHQDTYQQAWTDGLRAIRDALGDSGS